MKLKILRPYQTTTPLTHQLPSHTYMLRMSLIQCSPINVFQLQRMRKVARIRLRDSRDRGSCSCSFLSESSLSLLLLVVDWHLALLHQILLIMRMLGLQLQLPCRISSVPTTTSGETTQVEFQTPNSNNQVTVISTAAPVTAAVVPSITTSAPSTSNPCANTAAFTTSVT